MISRSKRELDEGIWQTSRSPDHLHQPPVAGHRRHRPSGGLVERGPGRCHPPAGPFQPPTAILASISPASSHRKTPSPNPLSSSHAPRHRFQRGAADCAGSARWARGGRRGGARRSDDNAQPRVGGTRHVGARRPRPLPAAAVTASVRGPAAPRALLHRLPALPLSRTSCPAREPAVFAVAVPAPRTRGCIMSSPPEGKLETKAGHPPAGTDSFPLSVLPRGARAGSNPRARGAGRGARRGRRGAPALGTARGLCRPTRPALPRP